MVSQYIIYTRKSGKTQYAYMMPSGKKNLLLFGHFPNGLDPPGTFFKAKRSAGKCFHLGHFLVQTQDKKSSSNSLDWGQHLSP